MYKIQTYHGHIIDYENPNPNQIDIRDIARNLSFENRFLGQAHGPYSVAQHCALGSELFIEQGKPEFALQFLLHDAAEAYLKDIPTPLKHLLGDAYKNIELKFELAIIEKFEVEDFNNPTIKEMDLAMLAAERHQLLPQAKIKWPQLDGVELAKVKIHPLGRQCEYFYLSVYKKLRGEYERN